MWGEETERLAALERKLDKVLEFNEAIYGKVRKIMGLVQIEQQDLDNFATQFENEVTVLTDASQNVTQAASLLGSYISNLLANQAQPLPEADESALKAALEDVTNGADAVTASVGTLSSLSPLSTSVPSEPSSDTPPADTTTGVDETASNE